MKPPLSSPPSVVPRPGRYIRGHHVAQPPQYLWSSASVAASRTCIQPCQSNAGTACSRNTENSKNRWPRLPPAPIPGLRRVGGLKECLSVATSSLPSTTPFLMEVQIGSLVEISSVDGQQTRRALPSSLPSHSSPSRPRVSPTPSPCSLCAQYSKTCTVCRGDYTTDRPRFPLPMSRQTVFC